mgnify:CR=1 FL=1
MKSVTERTSVDETPIQTLKWHYKILKTIYLVYIGKPKVVYQIFLKISTEIFRIIKTHLIRLFLKYSVDFHGVIGQPAVNELYE